MPPASTFCVSLLPKPTFCEDFDEVDAGTFPPGWMAYQQGGSLRVDRAAFVSPPAALRADVMPLAPFQPLSVKLQRQFPVAAAPSWLDFDLAVLPVAADTTAGNRLVVTALDFVDAASNRYTFQIALQQNGGSLGVWFEEQAAFAGGGAQNYLSHAAIESIGIGQWVQIHVSVVLTQGGGTARVLFDGRPEVEVPIATDGDGGLDPTLAILLGATTVVINLGSNYESEPSTGWTIEYDNVRMSR
jgi:hypothetical protein